MTKHEGYKSRAAQLIKEIKILIHTSMRSHFSIMQIHLFRSQSYLHRVERNTLLMQQLNHFFIHSTLLSGPMTTVTRHSIATREEKQGGDGQQRGESQRRGRHDVVLIMKKQHVLVCGTLSWLKPDSGVQGEKTCKPHLKLTPQISRTTSNFTIKSNMS